MDVRMNEPSTPMVARRLSCKTSSTPQKAFVANGFLDKSDMSGIMATPKRRSVPMEAVSETRSIDVTPHAEMDLEASPQTPPALGHESMGETPAKSMVSMGETPARSIGGTPGPKLQKKSTAVKFTRHRVMTKTPRGLAGRVAEKVCARTKVTASELSGAALAECIMQVTGPPSVTRSAYRARKLLTWLRQHAKRGSARVCGQPITTTDVKQAAKLVGDVWSPKLIKLQRRFNKKKHGLKKLAAEGKTEEELKAIALKTEQKAERKAEREARRQRARLERQEQGLDEETSSEPSEEEDPDASDLSGEEDVDSEVEGGAPGDFLEAPEPFDDVTYRGDWSGAPPLGSDGFNKFATSVYRTAGIAAALHTGGLDLTCKCPPLQPHQESAIFLLHPKSPVSRLLVDHPTGSGKTREMIDILNNFFHDPRPKVPIFPKEPVCRNFYSEMIRWPNLYRDYFCCLRPHCAARASGIVDWRSRRADLWDISHLEERELRAVGKEMREVLEMKGCFYMGRMRRFWRDDFKNRFPDEPLPASPLRALRYTSAGGSYTAIHKETGLPVSALLKIGFDKEDGNVYSQKIVLMDEVHNLVRTQTQYGEQLDHLRKLLLRASGTVLAGFTGTPIASDPLEGRQLLDIIKGLHAPEGDAGYISSFPMRPKALFARSLPHGIPDSILTPKLRHQFIRKVTLIGEAVQRYDKKRAAGLPDRRLQRYCNLCIHFGAMHDGKHGSKARVLEEMETCAPKLRAIATDVASEPLKAIVLIAKSSGMDALVAELRRLGAGVDGQQPFGVATMEELNAFNSPANLRGELYRVLVADANQCGEGVSFFTVRRVMIADVPSSPSALVQAVGRSIRMYGHNGLSQEEWTVNTQLYVAVLPRWMRSPLAAWAYRSQRHCPEPGVGQSKARRLIRRLIQVGIPTLETFKERMQAHFEKITPASSRPVAVSSSSSSNLAPLENSDAPKSPLRPLPSDSSIGDASQPMSSIADESQPMSLEESAGASSGGSFVQENVEGQEESRMVQRTENLAAKEGSTIVQHTENTETRIVAANSARPQVSTVDIISFLESVGLWDEAKQLRLLPEKRRQGHKQVRPAAAQADASTGGIAAQHYFLRALRWIVEAESISTLVEQMRFSPSTADEQAVQSLVSTSRTFVPALRQLRNSATDRDVLESLAKGKNRMLVTRLSGDGDSSSEGESSACDFGVDDASSGEENKGPAPLVLPPSWKSEIVRRGNRSQREYIDGRGIRYKTEQQARRAVDALRRSANMAQRLHQRFDGRVGSQVAASTTAEVPDDKRLKSAARKLFGLDDDAADVGVSQ